jgi:superoxide dismutase, Cu-Zn family
MKLIYSAVAVAVLAGCATGPAEPLRATAQLQPTKGNKTVGEVTFEQVGDKVHVFANVKGLKPGKQHGFHIHEAGDCSAPDGMSAKGHFNPGGKPHAAPGSGHAGDLPQLAGDKAGHGKLDAELAGFTVAPGPASIVGRGLIVHADPDDFKTQPTGNSGARIACGVIKLE